MQKKSNGSKQGAEALQRAIEGQSIENEVRVIEAFMDRGIGRPGAALNQTTMTNRVPVHRSLLTLEETEIKSSRTGCQKECTVIGRSA